MMNRMALKNCITLNKAPVMVIISSTLPHKKQSICVKELNFSLRIVWVYTK